MTQKARCPMPRDLWIFNYQGARAPFCYTFWIVPTRWWFRAAPGSQVEHRGQTAQRKNLDSTSENIKISKFGSASPYFWIAKIENNMWGHSESNLREKIKRGLRERMIQCLPWAKMATVLTITCCPVWTHAFISGEENVQKWKVQKTYKCTVMPNLNERKCNCNAESEISYIFDDSKLGKTGC